MPEYFCEFKAILVEIWWDWDLDCSMFYECDADDNACPLNYDGWANIDASMWIDEKREQDIANQIIPEFKTNYSWRHRIWGKKDE